MQSLLDNLILVACVLILVAGLVLGLWFAWRWRHLCHRLGAFECHLRMIDPKPKGWRRGLGCYNRDVLGWYAGLGFQMRPHYRFSRQDVTAGAPREPDEKERTVLFNQQQIVPLDDRRHNITLAELALSGPAMTAFVSWIEAAAPGRGRYGRVVGESAV